MKRLASALLIALCVAGATQSSAQVSICRPATLPLPGSPAGAIAPFQVILDENGKQVAPLPFLVFLGDVVLVDGDQALADQQTCLYYNQGRIDPGTWSDVLHFDNNPVVPSQATLYSDCEPNNPADPCLPPFEIDFRTAYAGATQLVNPVFISESSTGPTQYQPIPGVPVTYIIDSDPVEPPSHPGCPTVPGTFIFTLNENCTGTKVINGVAEIAIDCQLVDPVTNCPAFVLDAAFAFSPGWVRIHEGSPIAPVSDQLHFFGGHFVSFCSDRPDTPAELPEAADVGILPIPAGDPDPIVDIVEDRTPIQYACGSALYLINSDPPEPTPTHQSTWGRIKTLYR